MAAYGWHARASVTEGLAAEGERFAFDQAVRLLEAMQPRAVPVGEGVEPAAEAVRFRSRVDLGFPASEVRRVELPEKPGEPARMEVAFFGLAGPLGPLPRGITELLIDRRFVGDGALRSFLDIFDHRLISLFFRGRKKTRPALDRRPPDRGRAATALAALAGLGTPHLAGRMAVADRALLFYTGLLVGPRRSMIGLERLLAHFFRIAARIVPFRGRWLPLGDRQTTVIGASGRNRELGRSAVAGRRLWDQGAAFDLELGPLSLRQLLSFLPTGEAFPVLRSLVRFYCGDELDCRLRLTLRGEEVPALSLGAAGDVRLGWSARLAAAGAAAEPRLGRAGGARLGWTSWLVTGPVAGDLAVDLGILGGAAA